MSDVADRLKRCIAEQVGMPVEKVGDNASLDDLGMDSLDLVELVMEAEQEFGVDIDDSEIDLLVTVRDAISGIERLLGEDDMARTRRQQEDRPEITVPPVIPLAVDALAAAEAVTATAEALLPQLQAAADAAAEIVAAAPRPPRLASWRNGRHSGSGQRAKWHVQGTGLYPTACGRHVTNTTTILSTADFITRPTVDCCSQCAKSVSIASAADLANEIATRASRGLTFDPFTLAGTEQAPIYVVEVDSLRRSLPSSREYGLRDRLRVCQGQFEDRQVYSFTKEKLLEFLANIKKVVTSRHGTSTRHVEMIRIGARTRMPPELIPSIHQEDFPEYQIEDFAGRGSAFTAIVGAILAPVLRRKIVFTDQPVFSDRGAYQIYVAHQSGMRNRRVRASLHRIYDLQDSNDYPQGVALYETDQANGSVIAIQDREYNLAELHPNGMMILLGLRDDFFSIRLFHRILMESVRYLADPGEYERLRDEMRRQFRLSQQQYIVDCATRALEYVENNLSRNQSANNFRSISRRDHIEQQIRNTERQLSELHLQLFAVNNTNQQATMDRIRREFDFLADGKFAMVKNVFFSPNGDFHMVTDPIVAFDRQQKKYHLLGPCEAVIEFPGKRDSRLFGGGGGVMLQQHVSNGHQRLDLPHCRGSSVCFGNISHEITSLVAGFELQALASLLVTFLQRPNPYDPDGRRVRNFPECPKPSDHDAEVITAADERANRL